MLKQLFSVEVSKNFIHSEVKRKSQEPHAFGDLYDKLVTDDGKYKPLDTLNEEDLLLFYKKWFELTNQAVEGGINTTTLQQCRKQLTTLMKNCTGEIAETEAKRTEAMLDLFLPVFDAMVFDYIKPDDLEVIEEMDWNSRDHFHYCVSKTEFKDYLQDAKEKRKIPKNELSTRILNTINLNKFGYSSEDFNMMGKVHKVLVSTDQKFIIASFFETIINYVNINRLMIWKIEDESIQADLLSDSPFIDFDVSETVSVHLGRVIDIGVVLFVNASEPRKCIEISMQGEFMKDLEIDERIITIKTVHPSDSREIILYTRENSLYLYKFIPKAGYYKQTWKINNVYIYITVAILQPIVISKDGEHFAIINQHEIMLFSIDKDSEKKHIVKIKRKDKREKFTSAFFMSENLVIHKRNFVNKYYNLNSELIVFDLKTLLKNNNDDVRLNSATSIYMSSDSLFSIYTGNEIYVPKRLAQGGFIRFKNMTIENGEIQPEHGKSDFYIKAELLFAASIFSNHLLYLNNAKDDKIILTNFNTAQTRVFPKESKPTVEVIIDHSKSAPYVNKIPYENPPIVEIFDNDNKPDIYLYLGMLPIEDRIKLTETKIIILYKKNNDGTFFIPSYGIYMNELKWNLKIVYIPLREKVTIKIINSKKIVLPITHEDKIKIIWKRNVDFLKGTIIDHLDREEEENEYDILMFALEIRDNNNNVSFVEIDKENSRFNREIYELDVINVIEEENEEEEEEEEEDDDDEEEEEDDDDDDDEEEEENEEEEEDDEDE